MKKTDAGTIHIALNIDDRYIQHCGVMLTSMFENNKDERFEIHVVTGSLSPENVQVLSEITASYDNKSQVYQVGDELLKGFPLIGSYISLAAYYRCFLDRILPAEIDKVLYLDCDMIVADNIRELWDTDISLFAIGCVEDRWSEKPETYERLKYDPKFLYFNSGMMLINLDYWRRFGTASKTVEYISNHPERILYNDQDVLNALFYDNKLMLPFKWNVQDGFFRKKRKIREEVWMELDEAIRKPAIIHYTGHRKPWIYTSEHPYKNQYYKYLSLTTWKDYEPKKTGRDIIKMGFYSFLYHTGLKRKFRIIK